jgi:catechol 1,2-dioxygenase
MSNPRISAKPAVGTSIGQRRLDRYLWDDFAFASREGLVPAIRRVDVPEELARRGVTTPFASIDFDFRLYGEATGAPPAEVERERASA